MMLTQRQTLPGATSPRPAQVAFQLRASSVKPFRALSQRSRRSSLQQRTVVQAATDSDKVPRWEYVFRYLKYENNLESLSPQKAKELTDSGDAVIIDVRPRNLYDDATPIGAKSAPLFQLVDWSKPSFAKVLRAGALMANGVTPVEPNPDFLEDVRKAAGGKGVILACEGGGTTEPTPSFQWGKASRSLTAAYRVMKSKAANPVYHLEGGVYNWYKAFGDEGFTGEYDTGNIGRTPNAAGPVEFPDKDTVQFPNKK